MHDHETEYVFIASPAQLRRLPGVLRLLAPSVVSRRTQTVEDTYLDTRTRMLMRSGVACRLRRTGGKASLTLKSLMPLRKGLASRTELTEAIQDAACTWPARLPGRALRARLSVLAGATRFDRLFTLSQRRRVYALRTADGTQVEISADAASLQQAPSRARIYRIEVELCAGATDTLRRVASRLRHALHLEPATQSKFEYGLHAAGLALPMLREDAALELRPADSARRAAARAVQRHVRRILWHVPGTALGINPECLHDMRVGVRRLRAVVRLFGPVLPARAARTLTADLKWLGGALGAVRDLDVQIATGLANRHQDPAGAAHSPEALYRIALQQRRERSLGVLRDSLRSPRFRALQQTCRRLVATLSVPAPGTDTVLAARLLRRSDLKSILKAGRAATHPPAPAALHRFRVKCKRFRYACETLGPLYGKPVLKMARRLAALQDVLGAVQDTVSVQWLIRQMLDEITPDTPDGTRLRSALLAGAVHWRAEQHRRRKAVLKAWRKFERWKGCRTFLKAIS